MNFAPIQYSLIQNKLSKLESNNNHSVVNQYGYLGKYQFGELALMDLKFKKNKKWVGKYGIYNKEAFLSSPIIQDIAFSEWINILLLRIKRKKLYKYIGKTFKKSIVTREGLLAGCHLIGCRGLEKALKQNKDVTDGNGTKVSKYLEIFSKLGVLNGNGRKPFSTVRGQS